VRETENCPPQPVGVFKQRVVHFFLKSDLLTAPIGWLC